MLYLKGSRKKFPSDDGREDGQSNDDDNDNLNEEIQDLFAIFPTDGAGSSNTAPSPGDPTKNKSNRRNGNENKRFDDNTREEKSVSVSSLLPPPMNKNPRNQSTKATDARTTNDEVSKGLSTWEDFLGGTATPSSSATSLAGNNRRGGNGDATRRTPPANNNNRRDERPTTNASNAKQNGTSSSKNGSNNNSNNKDVLPSIADLFPSDFSSSGAKISGNSNDGIPASPTPPALDGVLPVSDLFYRSAQSTSDGDDDNNNGESDNKMDDDRSRDRDDEELPFSAEQSDQLTTSLNKIKIRRNKSRPRELASPNTTRRNNNNSGTGTTNNPRKSPKKRKLQRRGMEMLVGGVPINADPPQRFVELTYQHDKNADWKDVIATNTRDFGPMYYNPSVTKLSEVEKGLYCEFFLNSTLKWNVCPKDLRRLVNKNDDYGSTEEEKSEIVAEAGGDNSIASGADAKTKERLSADATESTMKEALRRRMVGSMKEAFRKAAATAEDENQPFNVNPNAELSGELVFSIGVSKEDLESSGGALSAKTILERVLATGISTSTECTGFDITFSKLQLSDLEDGMTTISAEFLITIEDNESMSFGSVKKKCNKINSSLAQAMDDGDMQLAMAAAAKKEKAWSKEFRNRVVEEFLFDDDDGDGPLDGEDDNAVSEALAAKSTSSPSKKLERTETQPDLESTIDSLLNDLNYEVQGFKNDQVDVPFGMPGSPVYSKDDIFLGGGNDGVFWNYSADNAARAPYQGKLGLRIVDAVTERAKQRHPRVIAIGDVHGCIDELQDLLRKCDYRPGDLVVFLGDLVSKGPDSMAVVQMAREIGAIGVRGNHDFEVVRWHQAIKSGVDAPVVGSEHFHIANCLTKADMKWMYSLPWYISSPDLGALFVHAGFVSGIRLAKQNPRLMMNMRSILPDGTVTSKFFNNWPWARLWDGPQTVLFGHDADRGLQQYEHAIGLDTGCVYGGRLTACILPEKRLVSVNARREYFKYRRKHYD